MKAANLTTLILLCGVYYTEWSILGWLDPYALFWIPALVVGTVYS